MGRHTYHVTLKFLGEVQQVEAVRQGLRTVHAPAFQVAFGGVGFFPNARAPRVFWAGVHAPAVPSLVHAIDQALAALDFPPEGKVQPHLTLARNGSGRPRPLRGEQPPEGFAQLSRIVASGPAPEFGTMTAREFILYESRLSPSGPSYYKLEGFELAR